MELEIIIDKNQKGKIVIYAGERTALIDKIEKLVSNEKIDLIGYTENAAVRLDINEIICFVTENNKVFAITENGKYRLKYRLYQLEEYLGDNFVKINQSCIGNIKKTARFKATIGGALNIEFINGYTDYVSRRNLKSVKEKFKI